MDVLEQVYWKARYNDSRDERLFHVIRLTGAKLGKRGDEYYWYLGDEPLPTLMGVGKSPKAAMLAFNTVFYDGQEKEVMSRMDGLVEALNLSVRSEKYLKMAGLTTWFKIAAKSKCELMGLDNIGRKSFTEIKEVLLKKGIRLKGEG